MAWYKIVLIVASVLWVLLFITHVGHMEGTFIDGVKKGAYLRHLASPLGIIEFCWGASLAMTRMGGFEFTLESAGVVVLVGFAVMNVVYVLIYHIIGKYII